MDKETLNEMLNEMLDEMLDEIMEKVFDIAMLIIGVAFCTTLLMIGIFVVAVLSQWAKG